MKLLVLGKPIHHSKSPEIHNFWLKKNNILEKYGKKEIQKDQIKDYLVKVKQNQLIGLNITVPYKERFFEQIENLDMSSIQTGAVNTIFKKNNKVCGANTDGIGFINSLKYDCNFKLKRKNVLIIGAGGASRGISYAIIKNQINSLTIMNRSAINLMKLVKKLRKEKINSKIFIQDWADKIVYENINIIINTTSLGLSKHDKLEFDFSKANKNCLVYDLIYNPVETYFLKQAQQKNLKTYNGLGMLCRQAAESFRMWFDLEVEEEHIQEIMKKLKKKNK